MGLSDTTFSNPYADEIERRGGIYDPFSRAFSDVVEKPEFDDERWAKGYKNREELTRTYAWAIPNEEAIRTIVELSPILEIGAGLGYWAHLIFNAGGDIIAYDKTPKPIMNDENPYVHADTEPWSLVHEGDVRKAMAGGRWTRTLFLCWPPYGGGMAAQALRLHRGEHVVYVGESWGGCTADDEFFELLRDLYEPQTGVALPQWPGLHDSLEVWKRK